MVIENNDKKLYITYKAKEYSTVVDKVDELIDFYKTIADPYIPFPEYSLGLKEKERKERMDEYMFGGLRGEM